ncbi:MAG: DUF3987 domain-containing protein [Phycisphaeraceae bacterium]|nr:DUF3987 domain-containing protein [Phycisphaeraceae bacterium]
MTGTATTNGTSAAQADAILTARGLEPIDSQRDEREILGAALLDLRAYRAIRGLGITASMFSDSAHAAIWRSIHKAERELGEGAEDIADDPEKGMRSRWIEHCQRAVQAIMKVTAQEARTLCLGFAELVVSPASVVRIAAPGLLEAHRRREELLAAHAAMEAALEDRPTENAALRLMSLERPLKRDRTAAPKRRGFPVDQLPAGVARFVSEMTSALGLEDASFTAVACLGVVAGACGGRWSVTIKRGYTVPLTLWVGLVGESGSKKSPALEACLKPLRDIQSRHWAAHREAQATFEREQKSRRRSRDAAMDASVEPEAPIAWRCLADDATVEALGRILQDNAHGVLIAADELGGFLMGLGRYTNARGADEGRMLGCFDGSALTVDRKGDGTVHIPRACVSILGGIQPGTLTRAFGPAQRDGGMLARFLLVHPPDRAGRWSDAEPSIKAIEGWALTIEALAGIACDGDEQDRPMPHRLELEPEAREMLARFHDEIAVVMDATDDGHLRSHLSKLRGGIVPRLAGLLHLIGVVERGGDPLAPEARTITAATMSAAVEIGRWFRAEAELIYGRFHEPEQEALERSLVEYIQRQEGGRITARGLHRGMSKRFKNTEQADRALRELAKAGRGRFEMVQGKTGRPATWFILKDENPEMAGEGDDTGEGSGGSGGGSGGSGGSGGGETSR